MGVAVGKLLPKGSNVPRWASCQGFLPSHIINKEGMPSSWPVGVKLLKCPSKHEFGCVGWVGITEHRHRLDLGSTAKHMRCERRSS
jgi:hypothetical protein